MVVVVVLVYLSIYPSIYPSIYLSICLSACLSVYLQAWKRSNSARLPQFLNLTTSKTLSDPVTSGHRRLHSSSATRSLSPDLHKSLKQFLRKWHFDVLAHQVPCHTPSFKAVFVKHASVLDQLCNHKQGCKNWSQYKKAASTLRIHIGSCRDHSLRAFSLRNLPS